MFIRYAGFVVLASVVILMASCAGIPATPTSMPPSVTCVPSSATPVPPTATPVPPTATPVNQAAPTAVSLPPLSGSGGGVIAFVSGRGGNYDIYVMNADGSDQRQLTTDSANDGWPSWSPDGTQLAYQNYGAGRNVIKILNVADGTTRLLSTGLSGIKWEPAWSHDGKWIAFSYQPPNGTGDIYIVSPDGKDLRRLTDNNALDGAPVWSPDDKQIAFLSERDGNFEVYVMDADGSHQRRLTDNPAEDIVSSWLAAPLEGGAGGSKIAFSSNRDGNSEIYFVDPDGSNLVRITNTPAEEMYPVWSPDGTKLAYASENGGKMDIYVMPAPGPATPANAAGAAVQQLTDSGGLNFSPVWRPAAQDSAQAIVEELVAAKLEAMKAKDIEQYLALIDETDKEYTTEQRNWFLIYQDAVTEDFTIEVKQAEQIDATTIIASLYQHYLYGSEKADRAITYEARFVKTPNGWKDADLNFSVKETPHFVVKYPEEVEAKAVQVCEEAERAYDSVVKELGLEPQDKTIVKLYADQEMLRQSTDIRIAYLFNGWAEDGESIKMYAYRDKDAFTRVIAHELTHKITLGISDSQTSWLAEGLAVYFGSRPFQGGNALQLGRFTVEELSKPTTWLEENNLILLTDEETIGLYYAVSGMVVEFTLETYGLDKLHAVLSELSKYPRYNRGYDYAGMERETQDRLHQAIETVLGVDMDTFNQHWLEWINSQ